MAGSTAKHPPLDFNPQFQYALELMEHTSRNIFITGRAGTGKSTLLDYFRHTTTKKVAVIAPTGVSALNVRGQTIHSFFGFKPNITPGRIKQIQCKNQNSSVFKKLDSIVIDEISMVRADLLDCIDRFLRLNGPSPLKPFGGVQMVFVGDLYQLPPVVTRNDKTALAALYKTPYFYSAGAFEQLEMELIELEKIYRQHDAGFIALLNAIRNKSVTADDLELLNRRVSPDFQPDADDYYISLTTTNALARQINSSHLDKLRTPLFTFTADVDGDFAPEYYPTVVELDIKIGSQIMMLNNDSAGRWVNGSIGKVFDITPAGNGDYIIVAELDNGKTVEIEPYTWEIYRFEVDGEELNSRSIGQFTQYPLMLAWAVTIHKSQGKTFKRLILDIGRGTFTPGQIYVALSRCQTYEGIVLKQPILSKHIWTDFKVVDFLTKYQYRKAQELCPVEKKVEIITGAIENGSRLKITYLKPGDEKSRRVIVPIAVGEMEYQGKNYLGVRAFCLKRNRERVFRLDRILEIEELRDASPKS
ncbi:MAG: AAA family ATPase [Dehalococcoidaceae bacterium]|nr:AAA family ATPase [Dehalococcoidaceae bacterium]